MNKAIVQQAGTTESETVFVIDPDEWVHDALATLLGSSGYEVECFATAESFIESDVLAEPRPTIAKSSVAGQAFVHAAHSGYIQVNPVQHDQPCSHCGETHCCAGSGCDEPEVTKSDVQSKAAKPVPIRARSPTGTALAALRHGFRAAEGQSEFLRALEESSSDRALEKPPPRLAGCAIPPIAIPNDGSRGDPFNDRGVNRD